MYYLYMSDVKIMMLRVALEAVVTKNQQRKSSLETTQLNLFDLKACAQLNCSVCWRQHVSFLWTLQITNSSVEATVQQLTVLLHLKAQPACHRSSVGCKMANDLTLSHPYCVSLLRLCYV